MSWRARSAGPANGEEEDLSPFAPPSTDYTPPGADEGFEAFEDLEPPYGGAALELEPPYVSEEEEAASIATLRSQAAAIARQELARWNPGGVRKKETDPTMRETLRMYWQNVASPTEAEQLINNGSPWSSAFISWVMRKAGAGDSFKYSTAHRVYVGGGKKARAAGDSSKFWAYHISEARPQIGDVVVADRQPSTKAPCGGATYENVDDGSTRATHGDVVIDVRAGEIDVVGGNVGDSVSLKRIKLDGSGFVAQPNGCRFFAIMKPPGAMPVSAAVQIPVASDPAFSGDPNIKSVLGAIGRSPCDRMVSATTAAALVSGERDERRLTNLTLAARHPELPPGYRIQKQDTQLAQEWLRIRDDVIRPLLGSLAR